MEDLARLVAIIFLTVLVSGPLALLLSWRGIPILGGLAGCLAVVSGLHWLATAPSPIGLLGASNAILGVAAIWLAVRGIYQ